MACVELGWQIHVDFMITGGLFQDQEQGTMVPVFLDVVNIMLCSSKPKMLLLSLTLELLRVVS